MLNKTNRKYLLKYIKILSYINNTTESKISRKLGFERYYIYTTIHSGTNIVVNNLLEELSDIFGIPFKNFQNIIEGNNSIIQRTELMYKKGQRLLHKVNCIWTIRKQLGLSDKQFAMKLHTSYLNVRQIERNNRPNITTLLNISKVFNRSFILLATHFNYSINDVISAIKGNTSEIVNYEIALRHKHHLSQPQLANKLGTSQSIISAWERPTQSNKPTLHYMIKLSNLYKTPLIIFLHKHPKYYQIKSKSPAYKLLTLCQSNNVKVLNIYKLFNITIDSFIKKYHSTQSHVKKSLANQIIKYFNLPNNYFGRTHNAFSKGFLTYKRNNPTLSNKDIGYRIGFLLEKYNLTESKLAKKLGVSRARAQQLTQFKESNISDDMIYKLTDIFNNDKEYLLGNNTRWLMNCINSLTVQEIIESLKTYHNFSNKELSKMLDITASTLKNYEAMNNLGLSSIMKLAYYFNLPLLNLLRMNSKYMHISEFSPSYKILKYCVSNGVSIHKLASLSKITIPKLRYIINKKQRNTELNQNNTSKQLRKILNN